MIEYRDGDIFKQDDIDVIIHQCNCFNNMGKGIAVQVAKLYPEAVEADNRTKPGDPNKMGTYTVGVGKDGRHIVNMYSQYTYGLAAGRKKKHTDYEMMEKALREIIEDYLPGYLLTGLPVIIGVPYKMGCDLGGGNWIVVNTLLEKLFKDDERLHLVVCKL